MRDADLALRVYLKGPEDLVIIGTSAKSLYQVLEEKRLEGPDKAILCLFTRWRLSLCRGWGSVLDSSGAAAFEG